MPEMRRPTRAVAAGALAIGLAGCLASCQHLRTYEPVTVGMVPDTDVVQLRHATLPSLARAVAVHYWFAAFSPGQGKWSRWEVWQKPAVVPTSWGHVHKDLMHPDSGVGGGDYRIDREWRGKDARDIMAILNRPDDYPYRDRYRAWPGPNSNTYAAWVLRRAGARVDLHPKAVGKDYCGLIGASLSPTRTGVQADSPLLGLKVGLDDGVEVHILGGTIGLDLRPPALKTPFGRLGFPESSRAEEVVPNEETRGDRTTK